MHLSLLLAIGSDQLAVGTVSGLLVAFSAAVLKLYGKTQDERKASAEDRVTQVEEELARARADYQRLEASHEKSQANWDAEKARLEARIQELVSDLIRCWRGIDRRKDEGGPEGH